MKSYGSDSHEAAALNRLRDRCERWSDILLARFAVRGDVEDLAHDPLRLRDYIEEWSATMTDEAKQTRAALLLGSFTAAFPARPPLTANADLNGRIAQSILAIFPPELFGKFVSPAQGSAAATEQYPICRTARQHAPPSSTTKKPSRTPRRLRRRSP